MAMAEGSHLFPSRTQKLSLLAPMVLHWRRCGRVGHCQVFIQSPIFKLKVGFFLTKIPQRVDKLLTLRLGRDFAR